MINDKIYYKFLKFIYLNIYIDIVKKNYFVIEKLKINYFVLN